MTDKKIVLSSLSLDLRRVAQGYYRGSTKMADRFLDEAFKRRKEAESLQLELYLRILLDRMGVLKSEISHTDKAEFALMYSTLFQNASLSL